MLTPDKIIKEIEDVTTVQKAKLRKVDGNWNYDPYMLGMTNGLILALSLAKDEAPKFLKAPKEWAKDKPNLSLKEDAMLNFIDMLTGYEFWIGVLVGCLIAMCVWTFF